MKSLKDKYKGLETAVRIRIASKIKSKGTESEHRSERVLKVKDDQQFNIEGGRYLTEITATELIDNDGYAYNHSAIELEKLCEAVDNA